MENMMTKVFCKTLVLIILLCIGFGFTQSLAQKAHTELILDLSGSMWLELESGETKIDAAKNALKDLISNLPEDSLNMGLRVYGATVSGIDASACTDSQQIVSIAGLDKSKLISTIEARNPKGGTPIVYALNEAIKDFAGVPADVQKNIILVTDGQESCGQNLEVAIQNLRANGISLQVIGFGLSERASKAFNNLDAFVNTVTQTELTTALEETILDLNPVDSGVEVVVETGVEASPEMMAEVTIETTAIETTAIESAEPGTIQTAVIVTESSEAASDYVTDANIVITPVTTAANNLNILNISGPSQLAYNAAPTTYNLQWEGNPMLPLTVALKDIQCAFNGEDGGCIFESNPIQTPMNPIPLGITCSSRANSSNNSGYWTNEIKLIDADGIESANYLLEIRCVP